MTTLDIFEIRQCDLVSTDEVWLVVKEKRVATIINIGTEVDKENEE